MCFEQSSPLTLGLKNIWGEFIKEAEILCPLLLERTGRETLGMEKQGEGGGRRPPPGREAGPPLGEAGQTKDTMVRAVTTRAGIAEGLAGRKESHEQ